MGEYEKMETFRRKCKFLIRGIRREYDLCSHVHPISLGKKGKICVKCDCKCQRMRSWEKRHQYDIDSIKVREKMEIKELEIGRFFEDPAHMEVERYEKV